MTMSKSRMNTPDFRAECPSPPPFVDPEPQPPRSPLNSSLPVGDQWLRTKYQRDHKAWKENKSDFDDAVKHIRDLRSHMQQTWRDEKMAEEAEGEKSAAGELTGKASEKDRSRNEVEESEESEEEAFKQTKKTDSKTRNNKQPGKGNGKQRSDGVGMGGGRVDREKNQDEPYVARKSSRVQCDRCFKSGTKCVITPGAVNRSACDSCRKKKFGCTLAGTRDGQIARKPVSQGHEGQVKDTDKSDVPKLQGSTPVEHKSAPAVKFTTANSPGKPIITEDHSVVKVTEKPPMKLSTVKPTVNPSSVVKPDSSVKRVSVEPKSNPAAKRDAAESCNPDPNEALSAPHHADDAHQTARSSTPVGAAAAERTVNPGTPVPNDDDHEANPDPRRKPSDAEDLGAMRLMMNELKRSNAIQESMLEEIRRSNQLQEKVLGKLERSIEMQEETNRQLDLLPDVHSLLQDTFTSEVDYQQAMWGVANEMSQLVHPLTQIAMVALDRRTERFCSDFGAKDYQVNTTRKTFSPNGGPNIGSSSLGMTMQERQRQRQEGQKRGRDSDSVLEEGNAKRQRGNQDEDEENE
ncbi:hypothetical protein VKT23_020530 [Stygiomarasmius scandens]|uniref:Zn(2)-C6 fungal-type domain-containing protein n=1 Tax=Marasmiellus scandens TaxID=2682957 RepID=A0ABR1IIU4_9AGAR